MGRQIPGVSYSAIFLESSSSSLFKGPPPAPNGVRIVSCPLQFLPHLAHSFSFSSSSNSVGFFFFNLLIVKSSFKNLKKNIHGLLDCLPRKIQICTITPNDQPIQMSKGALKPCHGSPHHKDACLSSPSDSAGGRYSALTEELVNGKYPLTDLQEVSENS